MKKMIVGFTFLLSLSGFSQEFQENPRSVGNTLERIEAEKNVKCEYERSGTRITNMLYSWQKKYYDCGDFRVSLRVRASRDMSVPFVPGSRGFVAKDVVVTKIIFYAK